MEFSPIWDMGAGVIVAMYGITGLALWGIPAILIEGWILKWRSAATRPFRSSIIMNLISTIIGYVAAGSLLNTTQKWAIGLLGIEGDPYTIIYSEVGAHTLLGFLIIIVVTWTLSVIIEGGILMILEKNLPGKQIWQAVIFANLASYILPSVFLLYWISQNPATL